MDSTPQQGSRSAVIKEDSQAGQSSYSHLTTSSTNRSFSQSRKRKRGDDAISSLTERAQKRLHREEPVFQPSYSPMFISPRERMVFGGEEDFGARHLSMTEEGPCFNGEGSGLHSPAPDPEPPRNDFRYPDQVDVEDVARISNFDCSEQQKQPPLSNPSAHEDIHGASTQHARMKESRRGENTLLEAPFFAQSHGFAIHNSQFYACSGHGFNQAREQESVPSAAFCVISRDEFLPLKRVICTREGSRFNSAKRKGSDVIVQVFEGSEARELWQKTLKFSRRLVNAHTLAIIGISPTSADASDPHYIVFDGAGSRCTYRLIASMLKKGDREATVVGLRAVYGITSGLDYISKTILPLSDLGIDGFDAFSDGFSGHTQLAFTPNALDVHSALLDQQTAIDVEICNSFIKKIFNNANHTLHGDEADQHMKEEFTNSGRLTPQIESAGDPEISLVANTPQAAKRPPRREIIWNAFGFKSSLSYISQTYDNVIFDDSIQLPRRLGRSVIEYRRACSCEGYTREEITFTPDAFRNAVLIYQQPSPNERCGLCGELLPAPSLIPQPSNPTAPDPPFEWCH